MGMVQNVFISRFLAVPILKRTGLMVKDHLSRFWTDRRGGIVLMYALSLPVLAFAVGFAVDFGRAAQLRTRLNSAADAAALAALTPAMMAQSNAVAQKAAVSMFNGQAGALAGLANGDTTVTVTVTNPSNNSLIRNVSVCYGAAEQTIFAGILGAQTLGLSNCASAHAQVPPNIDFYLLLDNSPSMSLPATQAGITSMQSLTLNEENGGCAFACHQASTNNGDTAGNPCADGTMPTLNGGQYCASSHGAQIDNFKLARNNGITLRLDELTSAVRTMMATAQTAASTTPYNPPPVYRFAANSMDSLWQIGFNTLMPLTVNFSSAWTSAAANFGVMQMFSNNNVCANASCTSAAGGGDVESNYDNALSNANAQLPDPGAGTNQAGDKPQEILFFVTDGVEDEQSGGIRLIQPINGGVSTNYCSQIKARGIKIAILYTEYLPVPVNSFYVDNVEPFQPEIGPALQACASPGLYYDAAIGADLGQALSTLFEAAVRSASLTQ
jgi:hypothetical protein